METHLGAAGRAGGRARQAAVAADRSTSTTSSRSTTPTATTPATRCCANSPARVAQVDPRHRSRLPLRRRGIRRRHAGHRPHGRPHLAERLRQRVAAEPFVIPGGQKLNVTVSVGVAALDSAKDTPEYPQAGRRGALPGQERRPQPGRRRRGLTRPDTPPILPTTSRLDPSVGPFAFRRPDPACELYLNH